LLDGRNRWQLQELMLWGCNVGAEHTRILAAWPEATHLLYLDLSGNLEFDAAAAKNLFTSPSIRSLVHLDVSGNRLGVQGARALAAARDWDHLRSLNITATGVGEDGLRALLASPNLR